MELTGRFFELPERSCFLFGPRGTGKSTWLRHIEPDALYLDLLDPALHRSLMARPEQLRGHERVHGAVEGAAAKQVHAATPQLAGERKVVAGYIDILEDLLLAFRLPVFRKRSKRETVAHDKLCLFDAGVFRSLRPKGPLDRPSEVDGQALEGLVAQHLRAWAAYGGQDGKHSALHFWRTRGGSEVDFVVYGESGLQALEVKNATTAHRSDLRGLRTFRADYPEAEAALLYRGAERLRIDGIWCLPVEEFLRGMVPGRELFGWL